MSIVDSSDVDSQTGQSSKETVHSSSKTGTRGDTFGGTVGPVIAAIVGLATFLAFWAQIEANKQQRKDIQIERFESKFFKLIDYHRDNVSQMKYRRPDMKDEKHHEGTQVFTAIYYEIVDLLKEYQKNRFGDREMTLQEKYSMIDKIYQCVFYGAGIRVKRLLEFNVGVSVFKYITFQEKYAEYDSGDKDEMYYSGHVRRLGHYFRNIYNAVVYVDKQEFLTPNEKYEYVSLLRAQMSVYEQAVFFYNSISELGKIWELQVYKKDYSKITDKKEVFSELWITKYDLVRNALNNFGEISKGINVTDFYPLLNMEREEELCKFGILPFKHNSKYICRFCFNEYYTGYKNNLKEQLFNLDHLANNYTSDIMCDEPRCKTKEAVKNHHNTTHQA
ncbi:MAG: putative phage abortive infection protein [Bacteroidetes bacterium]|nr:putative phage abortive infection protein [Bacteroidota bacterium]